jgi:hypothetical protein
MSRTLQWVIGICAVVISLAVFLAVVGPWLVSFFGLPIGFGMLDGPWAGAGYGMMGSAIAPSDGGRGFGLMQGRSGMMGGGYGMMPWAGWPGSSGAANRISMDQARTAAEEYTAAVGTDLAVVEVMEFENNFYAIVIETGTGRGAFELLIDPFTGAVAPEPGPNMMWNDRYGHMSFGGGGPNRLSMEEARTIAQQALDEQLPGSKVHQQGMSFYGYYTFDFDGADGTIAGMLSIEAPTGAVWLHTWHGGFISEWEAEEMGS